MARADSENSKIIFAQVIESGVSLKQLKKGKYYNESKQDIQFQI